MFNLNVELQSEMNNEVIIENGDLENYLCTSCKRFINEINNLYNLDLEYDSSFYVQCILNKNIIKCSINCDSYDTILKIIQVFFRMEALEFKDYKFETIALQIDECIEEEVFDIASA